MMIKKGSKKVAKDPLRSNFPKRRKTIILAQTMAYPISTFQIMAYLIIHSSWPKMLIRSRMRWTTQLVWLKQAIIWSRIPSIIWSTKILNCVLWISLSSRSLGPIMRVIIDHALVALIFRMLLGFHLPDILCLPIRTWTWAKTQHFRIWINRIKAVICKDIKIHQVSPAFCKWMILCNRVVVLIHRCKGMTRSRAS